MKLEKLSNYTDEEIAELADFFNKERQNRTIRDKIIKELEKDYKKLLELFPDTHFYVTMKGEYDTFKVDVLDLLDSYFKGDDFEY
jgi:hypothetical protein